MESLGCLLTKHKRSTVGQAKRICNVVVVESLSHVQLFVTLRAAANQASLSFTIAVSVLKLMFSESMMPSHPLLSPSPLAINPS